MLNALQPAAAIKNVVVCGAGLMGSGIAQIAIEKGFGVTVIGKNAESCKKSKTKIMAELEEIAKDRFPSLNESFNEGETQNEFIHSCLQNLTFCANPLDANFGGADLVVETVAENLKVKQNLLGDIQKQISKNCIVATNTSLFRLQDVAKNFETKSHFAGLHFFNPVSSTKLVEVVKSKETTEEVYESLIQFCERLGKLPVRCQDTHGFILNRLLFPYLLEAIRMYERGDASIKDIDKTMKHGTGYQMGPFELIDFIGLDTFKSVIDGWHLTFPDDARYLPCESLDELVKNGKLGKKAGEGYMMYKK